MKGTDFTFFLSCYWNFRNFKTFVNCGRKRNIWNFKNYGIWWTPLDLKLISCSSSSSGERLHHHARWKSLCTRSRVSVWRFLCFQGKSQTSFHIILTGYDVWLFWYLICQVIIKLGNKNVQLKLQYLNCLLQIV